MKNPSRPHHSDTLNEDESIKSQGTPLNETRWTLGDSRGIVAGEAKEPLSTTIGWIVIPSLVFGLFALAILGVF